MKTIEVAEFLAADPGAADIEEAFARHLRENQKHFNEIFAIKADDRAVLASLIRRYKPQTIIETGTNAGCSTTIMALAGEATVYTFDIADIVPGPTQCTTPMFGYLFRDTPLASRITARYASTFDLKPDALPVADVWFIDSDHGYETVSHETSLARQNMAQKGGVMIYHDARKEGMGFTEVDRFLSDTFADYTLVNTRCGLAYVELAAGGAPILPG